MRISPATACDDISKAVTAAQIILWTTRQVSPVVRADYMNRFGNIRIVVKREDRMVTVDSRCVNEQNVVPVAPSIKEGIAGNFREDGRQSFQPF